MKLMWNEDHVTSADLDSVEISEVIGRSQDNIDILENVVKSQENPLHIDESASSTSEPRGIATGVGTFFVPQSVEHRRCPDRLDHRA